MQLWCIRLKEVACSLSRVGRKENGKDMHNMKESVTILQSLDMDSQASWWWKSLLTHELPLANMSIDFLSGQLVVFFLFFKKLSPVRIIYARAFFPLVFFFDVSIISYFVRL